MNDFIHSLLSLNWGDPRVLAFLVAIVIVAMARKWSFVVLIVLIVLAVSLVRFVTSRGVLKGTS